MAEKQRAARGLLPSGPPAMTRIFGRDQHYAARYYGPRKKVSPAGASGFEDAREGVAAGSVVLGACRGWHVQRRRRVRRNGCLP